MSSRLTFKQLFKEEQSYIEPNEEIRCRVSKGRQDQEPWVTYVNRDRVGLTFSGGGIRSATFNLGVLQGLFDVKVLTHVDYLSTVSGGGYTGGWWMAWLAREGNRDKMFPTGIDRREALEVTHLREFSNFLVPRFGYFQSEMWSGIVAVVGGLVPTLLVALATIALALLAWLLLLMLVFFRPPISPTAWYSLVIAVGTFAVLALTECVWCRRRKCDPVDFRRGEFAIHALFGVLLAAGGLFGVTRLTQFDKALEHPAQAMRVLLNGESGRNPARAEETNLHVHVTVRLNAESARAVERSETSSVQVAAQRDAESSRGVQSAPVLWWPFVPALAWLASLLVLIAWRFVEAVYFPRAVVASLDRVLGRLTALALAWFAIATIWQAGAGLSETIEWASVAAVSIGSGTLFVTLRNWIGRALTPARTASFWDTLKPFIPQVLAYLTIAALAVLIARLLAFSYSSELRWFWAVVASAIVLVLAALVFFEPNSIGLHAYYRGRIARAYLGASNQEASETSNRETDERVKDDIQLSQLPGRPFHLICCAANDLNGDPLDNLGRGSRSATLSKLGIAMGQYWKRGPSQHRLSAALTASAAAFNSNMGSVSMRLGRAVSFLMTALDLRLGLWVENPASNRRTWTWPCGVRFFKELFAWTNANSRDLHLSDGAHFENLGLYELVRRHCRYIILCDAGADPTTAFDDFGNAVRRIRADFGVEIDIDLEPLKPGTNGSLPRQHAVVGTIDYDRVHDKGTLIYFKPNLTGDEPYDVQQYQTRNKAFPNETTGDQFYDEAQWEAYRRLGEHAARSTFRFVEQMPEPSTPHAIFSGARWHWYPTPPGFEQALLENTGRYAGFEDTLRQDAPQTFLRELFPELNHIAGANAHPPRFTAKEIEKILGLLLQMIQVMEDVWLGCRLDEYWNHPLNLGWVNLFQRWAGAPSFRMWWPILKPLYGSRFRDFVERRLKVSVQVLTTPSIEEHQPGSPWPEGLACGRWRQSVGDVRLEGKSLFTYTVPLVYHRSDQRPHRFPIQVGVAAIHLDQATKIARWSADDFFVSPTLWGVGIGTRFLFAIFQRLFNAGMRGCEVELEEGAQVSGEGDPRRLRCTDVGSRAEHADQIEFYRGAGFVLEKPEDDKTPPTKLVRSLTEDVNSGRGDAR